jgi:hypothetical protein
MSKLIAWFDRSVYWLTYRAVNRHLRKTPGHAYLAKLSIDAWLEVNPPTPHEKFRARELFRKFYAAPAPPPPPRRDGRDGNDLR